MKQTFFLSLLLLGTTTFVTAQDKTIQKRFSNIKNIELSTSSGDITVKKGSGTDVNLVVRHSYDEDAFTPVMEERNGRLILKEEFTSGNHSGTSSWSLEVPDNTSMQLNTGSGDVSVDGLKADVKSNLGSGDVKLSSVNGELDFNTGSGDIKLTNADGALSFNTGSGNINANRGTGEYSFNAGSGDIILDQLSGSFAINAGSGDIEAKQITLQEAGSFNSGSGDATVSLSGDLDHDISINSGSGDANLDFNGKPIEGEVIMTADERNGEIIAPFNFDKEETLREENSSPRIRKTAKLGSKDIAIKVSTGSGTAEITK